MAGHKDGICPICGEEIEYIGYYMYDDDGATLDWRCPSCGATGKAVFDFTFRYHCVREGQVATHGSKINELSGFISRNYDGWATVGDIAFAEFMYRIAEDNGVACEHDDGLGGKRAVIERCKLEMYTSKRKMSFDEAQEKFLNRVFGFDGIYEMEANYTGYSEWTITGFDLDKCQLGGHDMNQILLSHSGEYANIRVECL